MNRHIILTGAVTGAGDTPDKNPKVPVTPPQIADDGIAGRPVAELDPRRDDCLVELLDLVQKYCPEAEGLEGRI